MSSDGWSRRRTKREVMEVKVPRGLSSHPPGPWRGLSTKCEMNSWEMQGRIGELGHEIAKFVTSPSILSKPPTPILPHQIHLCLPHLFLRRPQLTRISQPTHFFSLSVISAISSGRLHISVRLGSSQPNVLPPYQSPPITGNSGSTSPVFIVGFPVPPPSSRLQRLLLLVCHGRGRDSC